MRSTCWLARVARVLRGRRLDRNPLRRGLDRIETAVLGVLLAAFLAGAPFAVHAGASWGYALAAREAQAQRASLHQVPATLLAAAPTWDGYANGVMSPYVPARWRAPDGRLRTGEVLPPFGSAAGSTVLVWTDRAGQLTNSPLGPADLASRAQLGASIAVGSLAAALFAAGWLARRSLDRRRLAAWDAEWLANEPRWSRRR